MSTYYLLQGQESSQDEKAAAALHAVHLDDQYGGAPVQVSITEFPSNRHLNKLQCLNLLYLAFNNLIKI